LLWWKKTYANLFLKLQLTKYNVTIVINALEDKQHQNHEAVLHFCGFDHLSLGSKLFNILKFGLVPLLEQACIGPPQYFKSSVFV